MDDLDHRHWELRPPDTPDMGWPLVQGVVYVCEDNAADGCQTRRARNSRGPSESKKKPLSLKQMCSQGNGGKQSVAMGGDRSHEFGNSILGESSESPAVSRMQENMEFTGPKRPRSASGSVVQIRARRHDVLRVPARRLQERAGFATVQLGPARSAAKKCGLASSPADILGNPALPARPKSRPQILPKSAQHQSTSRRVHSIPGQIWPNVGQTSPRIDETRAKSARIWAKHGRMSAMC